ncbi:HET-domain-containing protein [Lentithecium fluviatile CBS 122367]|uniref:HET-domain-containing protein n=1 Tax=Lentithecium fluviatile CBS 122367 TaxID=1168545 RepID=A0A6G1INC8_9PLEO|nr:HET-domain-containing protein [Lentithecium fluviatile CBS 122367]
MRLLKVEDDGRLSLTEFDGNNIPPYAILSHTWGADYEEVTFKDVRTGGGKRRKVVFKDVLTGGGKRKEATFKDVVTGKGKSKEFGYKKILFCAGQAVNDDLEYFWIDTCCIDKDSSAELAKAINSMFRWYHKAAKCYVYLSDVSTAQPTEDPFFQQVWKSAFCHSKWFTRGWTLQELLAPKSVEFFSAEGERLGSRLELLQEIHEKTKIPIQALQGNQLSGFSIDERMSWAASRQTKHEEDAAYCLLGIFDIHMPLIYGEGRQKALGRLLKEIGESNNHGSLISPSTLSTVPFIRNSDFVDRPDILARIRAKCVLPTGHVARVALVGFGGVGKSQIAIEYAYSISGSRNTLVLWVYAGTKTGVEQDYRKIADDNRIPGRDQPEVDILGLVKKWLRNECQKPWTMILDNVDDRSMAEYVDNFIPQNGFVLVTSRSEDAAAYLVGGHTNIIPVGPMGKEQALDLLHKRLRREVEWDDGKASDLVKALEYIPLAISQAASFLNHKVPKYTLSLYLYEIGKEGEKGGYLEQAYPDRWRVRTSFEHANSVVLTWHKSFRCIQAERPTAAALLSVMSFFDRQEIPEHLVYISGARSYQFTFHRWLLSNQDIYALLMAIAGPILVLSYLGIRLSVVISLLAALGTISILPVISHANQAYPRNLLETLKTIFQRFYNWRNVSRVDIDEDIILLRNYAFISQDLKSNCYQMHRLVQLSVRKWLENKCRFTRIKEESLLALLEAFPTPDQEDWIGSKSLLPHAEAVMGFAPFRNAYLLPYTTLSHTTAYYARIWKGHRALRENVDNATARTRQLFDPKDVLALQCGFSLSWLLMSDGKYNEATNWAKRVLQGREMVFGSNSLDTLSAYSSLALMLQCQGNYEEAEQMSRKAGDGFKETLGVDHSITQRNNNILGSILLFKGRHTEAEELFLEVMNARKGVLGEEHPDTLTSMANLAATYRNQGRWKEAEELEVKVMETRNDVLESRPVEGGRRARGESDGDEKEGAWG